MGEGGEPAAEGRAGVGVIGLRLRGFEAGLDASTFGVADDDDCVRRVSVSERVRRKGKGTTVFDVQFVNCVFKDGEGAVVVEVELAGYAE